VDKASGPPKHDPKESGKEKSKGAKMTREEKNVELGLGCRGYQRFSVTPWSEGGALAGEKGAR